MGGVGVLGEDEDFATVERRLGEERLQGLEFGVPLRRDRLHQGQHLAQDGDVVDDVGAQGDQVEIGGEVTATERGQSIEERLFFVLIRFVEQLLGFFTGSDDALIQRGDK